MFTSGALVYILSYGVTEMLSHFGPHVFASIVLAGDIGGIGGMLKTFVGNITDILKGLGVSVAGIGIIVGGLMRATAFGNERKVAISNQAIACAIVGLVIVLVASTVASGMGSMFH
jgi:fucose 4-O-acetylase-like acetyltransferase